VYGLDGIALGFHDFYLKEGPVTEILPSQKYEISKGLHEQSLITEALFDALEAFFFGILQVQLFPGLCFYFFGVDEKEIGDEDDYEKDVVIAVDVVKGNEDA
jgi:hypothetical protein